MIFWVFQVDMKGGRKQIAINRQRGLSQNEGILMFGTLQSGDD
jgi:hypothetical protein